MYESFYKFSGKPFQLTPDPKFFFNSSTHKQALAYLKYGIAKGEGFIVITGDVGTGKTTLVSSLFQALDTRTTVAAKVVTTQLQADDLLRVVAAQFGLPFQGLTKADILRSLEVFCQACAADAKRVLLVVDEAQNLPRPSLEELRMLSNFEWNGKSLIQSFLLGQREFRVMMRSEGLEQLRQRVTASYHLRPLNAEETREYIEHRLKLVGWKGDPHIADTLYDGIFHFTQGVPRKTNLLCDRLLLYGCIEELHDIGHEALNSVLKDLQDEIWRADDAYEAALEPGDNGDSVHPSFEAHAPQRPRMRITPLRLPEALRAPADSAANADQTRRPTEVEKSLGTLTELLHGELQLLRRVVMDQLNAPRKTTADADTEGKKLRP